MTLCEEEKKDIKRLCQADLTLKLIPLYDCHGKEGKTCLVFICSQLVMLMFSSSSTSLQIPILINGNEVSNKLAGVKRLAGNVLVEKRVGAKRSSYHFGTSILYGKLFYLYKASSHPDCKNVNTGSECSFSSN